MQISEAPQAVEDLALMKRLKDYADGQATWRADGSTLGQREKRACDKLYGNLVDLVENILSPLIDRVTSREMETFTAHDRHHALKVCHIMAFIMSHDRTVRLTPPEIALLVLSAYLHDLGMGLSQEDRAKRLAEDSDIWLKTDLQASCRAALEALGAVASDKEVDEQDQLSAARRLHQAEEALLCADSRERHATRERYEELLITIEEAARASDGRVRHPNDLLKFGGDSIRDDLINICVSHNRSPDYLLEQNPVNPDELLFPIDAPYFSSTADVKFTAAVLRLADIMDFDRERTPDVLFHYLLPRDATPSDNTSVREWQKHLAITNWETNDNGDLVYRGVADDPVIHHAVMSFIKTIEDEINTTKLVLGDQPSRGIVLSGRVEAQIRAIGYRYLPYHFHLDQDRIYKLLMGGNIYETPLACVRELIQNSVDACQLRDALVIKSDPSYILSRSGRIKIIYNQVAGGAKNTLTVRDNGVGMDRSIIEKYFLSVGSSYFSSAEFRRLDADLRRQGINVRPVSEFGIGFLSCFLLGERVSVTTTRLPQVGDETREITLEADGVSRLIFVKEAAGDPLATGTSVSIELGSGDTEAVTWGHVADYVRQVAVNLPFDVEVAYLADGDVKEAWTQEPRGDQIFPPAQLAHSAYVIDFADEQVCGRVILFAEGEAGAVLKEEAAASPVVVGGERAGREMRSLLRGGFLVSEAPGIPRAPYLGHPTLALVELSGAAGEKDLWRTNLARSRLVGEDDLAVVIQRHIIEKILRDGPSILALGRHSVTGPDLADCMWLQEFDAKHIYDVAQRLSATTQGRRDAIKQWESRKDYLYGGYFPNKNLHNELLSLVLPKVCGLRYDDDGDRYYAPPGATWRSKLRGWRTFIEDPISWGQFATYEDKIDDCVYFSYASNHVMNSRYIELFSETPFSLGVAFHLFDALINWLRSGRQAHLSPQEADALTWLVDRDEALVIGAVAERRLRIRDALAHK